MAQINIEKTTTFEPPPTGKCGIGIDTDGDAVVIDESGDAAKLLTSVDVEGLWDDRGNYDASGDVFPSTGGSGTAGAILKGDIWLITVAGTLGGTDVEPGQTVRALTDTPGQTAGNWAISTGGSGGTSELPGSGVRIVEASDGAGTLSATKTIVNAKLTDATAITRLTTTSNWDINGAYTGTAITGTYEGQYYRNDEYFFFAYADNDWIRMIRL